MTRTIAQMNSFDIKSLLKSLTGINFVYCSDGPDTAEFTLKAENINSIEIPCLEWCVKNKSGLLFITEPVTRRSYWQLPDDLGFGDMSREEAEKQIMDDFVYYLEQIEQTAYVASNQYGIRIRMERSNEPRLFVFIGNHKTDDDFVTAISALDQLLPQLPATA